MTHEEYLEKRKVYDERYRTKHHDRVLESQRKYERTEKGRARVMAYQKGPKGTRLGGRRHEWARITRRDGYRLKRLIPEGFEIHHLRYHVDNKDPFYIDDIVILTVAEHKEWHKNHPDFKRIYVDINGNEIQMEEEWHA